MDNKLDVKAFWERLSIISKTRNVTQITLCAELGIDLQQFRNKKSLGSFPTLEQLVRISEYFGVSINYMLTGATTDDVDSELKEELEAYKLKTAELEVYKTKFDKIKNIVNASDTSSTPSNE